MKESSSEHPAEERKTFEEVPWVMNMIERSPPPIRMLEAHAFN